MVVRLVAMSAEMKDKMMVARMVDCLVGWRDEMMVDLKAAMMVAKLAVLWVVRMVAMSAVMKDKMMVVQLVAKMVDCLVGWRDKMSVDLKAAMMVA